MTSCSQKKIVQPKAHRARISVHILNDRKNTVKNSVKYTGQNVACCNVLLTSYMMFIQYLASVLKRRCALGFGDE